MHTFRNEPTIAPSKAARPIQKENGMTKCTAWTPQHLAPAGQQRRLGLNAARSTERSLSETRATPPAPDIQQAQKTGGKSILFYRLDVYESRKRCRKQNTKSNITKVLQLDTTKHALPCLIVVTSPTPPNPTTILT